MTRFIEAHRDRFGVEPICRVLQFAPSTYYAARRRVPSARRHRDEELKVRIRETYEANRSVYGARKLWHALRRGGTHVGRCTVERLMRDLQIQGASRRRRVPRTTQRAHGAAYPPDLVERNFRPIAPNRLWVADLTYVRVPAGHVYVAFVIDAFSRRIVGWQVSASLTTDVALDALELALCTRAVGSDLTHHSDRGVQYVSIRYTERLAEAGIERSVGSRGDSYDNALAETVIGLYKTELVSAREPWPSLGNLELATLRWVDWYNQHRLFGPLGYVPPAEYEHIHSRRQQLGPTPVGSL